MEVFTLHQKQYLNNTRLFSHKNSLTERVLIKNTLMMHLNIKSI